MEIKMENENELGPDGELAQSVLDNLGLNDSTIIQDNTLPFLIEDKFYRCRMPNQKEKTEAEDRRNRLYFKLLKEGGYLTRKQLKTLLKDKQDVDIEELELEKTKLLTQLQDFYLTLAQKMTEEAEVITTLKKEIVDIRAKYMKVSFEIITLLSACIEDRLEKEYMEYLTYLCTEQLEENGTWSKIWGSYDDFQSKNSKLENKAVEHLVYLFVNIRD